MYYKLFRIIVALLVFVADQWLYGEALQKSPVTRKYERDYRRCDTFFHTRTINGEKVRQSEMIVQLNVMLDPIIRTAEVV